MARQKTKPVEEPNEAPAAVEVPEPTQPQAKLPTLSAAVKECFESNPDAKLKDLRVFLATNYPTLPVNEKTLSATASALRRKLGTKSAVIRAASDSPTLDDLLHVRALAEEEGGIDALRDRISSLLEMAKELGGIERLLLCLDGLVKLAR